MMDIGEALKISEALLAPESLNKVQKTVFQYCWQGDSYAAIAKSIGYEYGYIKDVGAQLWQRLSQALNQKVTKNNFRGILQHYAQNSHQGLKQEYLQPFFSRPPSQYLEENIDTSIFYGRDHEIKNLASWISGDRCRLVAILGQGGIGKTSLATKLIQQIKEDFDCVIWRSLRNAPLFSELFQGVITCSDAPAQANLDSVDDQISDLMTVLRQQRCLLVLDNLESILQSGELGGRYQSGYQAYGQLLRRVADEPHQSCVLLTSRERPIGLANRSINQHNVRSLQLGGLSETEGKQLLATQHLIGANRDLQTLVRQYGGNPLILNIAAACIQSIYAGDVNAFLQQGTSVFGGIGDLLDQQFQRLSMAEQRVLYKLAYQEGTTLKELQVDMVPSLSNRTLHEALESLIGRSLIESSRSGFSQQSVITEYLTERMDSQFDCAVETSKI